MWTTSQHTSPANLAKPCLLSKAFLYVRVSPVGSGFAFVVKGTVCCDLASSDEVGFDLHEGGKASTMVDVATAYTNLGGAMQVDQDLVKITFDIRQPVDTKDLATIHQELWRLVFHKD